jgi:hypothetical protein
VDRLGKDGEVSPNFATQNFLTLQEIFPLVFAAQLPTCNIFLFVELRSRFQTVQRELFYMADMDATISLCQHCVRLGDH